MTHQLDEVDHKIINCLVEDGRMSAQAIARQFGLSERTIRNRLARLLANKVISVSANINKRALGYGVTADIFCEVESRRVSEVAEQIAQLPEVGYVACSLGDQDISVQVYARSNQELYEIVEGKLAQIPGIIRTRTVVVPRIVKSVWEWQVPLEPEKKDE